MPVCLDVLISECWISQGRRLPDALWENMVTPPPPQPPRAMGELVPGSGRPGSGREGVPTLKPAAALLLAMPPCWAARVHSPHAIDRSLEAHVCLTPVPIRDIKRQFDNSIFSTRWESWKKTRLKFLKDT